MTTSVESQSEELWTRVYDAQRFYRYFSLVESRSRWCHRAASILILVSSSFSALSLFSAIEILSSLSHWYAFGAALFVVAITAWMFVANLQKTEVLANQACEEYRDLFWKWKHLWNSRLHIGYDETERRMLDLHERQREVAFRFKDIPFDSRLNRKAGDGARQYLNDGPPS